MAKKRIQLDEKVIMGYLPTPPNNYSYRVEHFSTLVWRVWLVNHGVFSHTTDEVKTVWGFVRSTGDVMKPRNSEKVSREKACFVSDIPQNWNYSVIQPKYYELKNK